MSTKAELLDEIRRLRATIEHKKKVINTRDKSIAAWIEQFNEKTVAYNELQEQNEGLQRAIKVLDQLDYFDRNRELHTENHKLRGELDRRNEPYKQRICDLEKAIADMVIKKTT